MRLCSHGCGGMADIERESTSRKDFKMDNNSIRKHNSGFLGAKQGELCNVRNSPIIGEIKGIVDRIVGTPHSLCGSVVELREGVL